MKIERHRRKCQVCHHPQLDDIRRDFMASEAVYLLDKKYDLAQGSARRHAIAMGWFEERQQNSIATLDRFIADGMTKGKVNSVRVSGANIIKALELKAKLTGELKESPQPKKLKAI
jgi:hypothetical protein